MSPELATLAVFLCGFARGVTEYESMFLVSVLIYLLLVRFRIPQLAEWCWRSLRLLL